MCRLHDFFSGKVRFIYTSTVTRSHSYYGKNYSYASPTSCSLYFVENCSADISDVCINHVFYADDLCLMAPCATALQELLNICYRYSVEVNLNFNATKSFCVAFTPKHYKLSLPPLFMNISPIMYTDSIKYLGFTFTSNHCDDADILKQIRMLYCRSNRLVIVYYLISAVNQYYLSYVEVFALYSTVHISGQIIRKLLFPRYEWH